MLIVNLALVIDRQVACNWIVCFYHMQMTAHEPAKKSHVICSAVMLVHEHVLNADDNIWAHQYAMVNTNWM